MESDVSNQVLQIQGRKPVQKTHGHRERPSLAKAQISWLREENIFKLHKKCHPIFKGKEYHIKIRETKAILRGVSKI
jgi:hypothetical protein